MQPQSFLSPQSLPHPSPHLTSSPFVIPTPSTITLFIPCYLSTTLLTLSPIPTASLSLTLNLSHIAPSLQTHIISNLRLEFLNTNTTINLSSSAASQKIEISDFVFFNYIGEFPMNRRSDGVIWAPFDREMMEIVVSVGCTGVMVGGKEVRVKFNLMERESGDIEEMFRVEESENGGHKEFGISRKSISVVYTSFDPSTTPLPQLPLSAFDDQLLHLHSYHYAHYSFYLYRHPGVIVLSFYLPIFLFLFLNISIFYSTPLLHERISDLSTLLLASIAFMQILREKLFQHNNLILPDISFYLLVMNCLLGLYEALGVRGMQEKGYRFDWNWRWWVCVVTLVGNVVVVGVMYTVHKLVWEPGYYQVEEKINNDNSYEKVEQKVRKRQSFQDQSTIEQEFVESWKDSVNLSAKESVMYEKRDESKWGNSDSDRYFQKYIGHIVPMKYFQIEQVCCLKAQLSKQESNDTNDDT